MLWSLVGVAILITSIGLTTLLIAYAWALKPRTVQGPVGREGMAGVKGEPGPPGPAGPACHQRVTLSTPRDATPRAKFKNGDHVIHKSTYQSGKVVGSFDSSQSIDYMVQVGPVTFFNAVEEELEHL